jgi:hypothetical protein
MEAVNSFLDSYFSTHFPANIAVNAYVISQRLMSKQSSFYVRHVASHTKSGFSTLDADVLVKLFHSCCFL